MQACAAILTSLEQIVVTVDDEIFHSLSDIVRISQVRQKEVLHFAFIIYFDLFRTTFTILSVNYVSMSKNGKL